MGWSLFLIELQAFRPSTQIFSCESLKTNYFVEHLRTTTSALYLFLNFAENKFGVDKVTDLNSAEIPVVVLKVSKHVKNSYSSEWLLELKMLTILNESHRYSLKNLF